MKQLHKSIRRILLSCSMILAVSSCALVLAPEPTGTEVPFLMDEPRSGTFDLSVDAGSNPKDIYFVFTGEESSLGLIDYPSVTPKGMDTALSGPITFTDERGITHVSFPTRSSPGQSTDASKGARSIPVTINDALAVNGTSEDFNVVNFATNRTTPIPATCRLWEPSIAVGEDAEHPTRSLSIWVADDCWETGGTKPNLVTIDMVNALAAKFLQAGADNDIYDWVTAILGPEWGDTAYSNLIGSTDNITILLADIGNDNSANGGIVGYFDSANNFFDSALPVGYISNERIMFVIDAVMYANPVDDGQATGPDSGGWQQSDYWVGEVFSTLAHEFQHMIHFYQKGILARGDGHSADVWIDEMCAQLTEDFLADKMQVPGPRGVAFDDYTAGGSGNYSGRIPSYNYNTFLPLVVTENFGLDDYSTAYAFGAWLVRNYGGASLLRSMVQNEYTDPNAVLAAVYKMENRYITFNSLIKQWAVAVLASNRTDMPAGYRFNTGTAFTSSLGGLDWNLGSINFHNYRYTINSVTYDGLNIHTTLVQPDNTLQATGNVYFRAALGATSKKTFTVTVPSGLNLQIYLE